MPALIEIKKRISSTQNTRKITKAMELVAASKMRKFQTRAISAREYTQDLSETLYKNLSETTKSPYTEVRESGKTLFVLYTSDKGLCGSLNNKIINALVRSDKWNNLAESERGLITIGKKSHQFAVANKLPVEKHFIGVSEDMSHMDAITLVDEILELWNKGEVKEVIFIAPHYKNSFTFYPVMKTFLPFTKESLASNFGQKEAERINRFVKVDNGNMIYSPEEEVVLNRIYEYTIQGMFTQAFLELKASEYSSRMIAMQNATGAADDRISQLKRQYNKARQQAITQEIAELIGASMAMSQ